VKRIVADPAKCVACKACELACAVAHAEAESIAGAAAEPLARSRIVLRQDRAVVVPSQCRHCEDAPCISACPEGAIARDGDDAPVIISADKCKGIGACAAACPFDAIRLVPFGKESVAIKCDLCAGLDGPACVDACPTGALRLAERGEVRFEINAETCRACQRCKKACPVDAIEGKKKTPHVIDQAKCMLCGRCYQTCPFGAVALVVAAKVG